MRCSGALRLLGVAAVMAVALGGSIVDCEGTELHELVVKYALCSPVFNKIDKHVDFIVEKSPLLV